MCAVCSQTAYQGSVLGGSQTIKQTGYTGATDKPSDGSRGMFQVFHKFKIISKYKVKVSNSSTILGI